MTYATTADVVVSLGRALTTDEATRAAALLTRVETIITRRITDLATRITAEPALEDVVIRIEADAVARVLLNPDGTYQEKIDDYSYTRDRAVSSGALYISDDEWDELLTTPGTSIASEAFTIRPYGTPGYAVSADDDGTWITPTDFVP